MMLRTAILATTTLLALGAAGCSSSAPPPAQGDLQIHIASSSSTPNGKTCNVAAHNATIGDTPPDGKNAGSRVQDGNAGAFVQCKVTGSSTFTVSASIRKGGVSFEVNGTVPSVGGGDGTATISSFDPTSAMTMNSPDNTPCAITPIQVAGGRIWAHFSCSGFVDSDSPTTYCEADGFFVFENCDQ